eukprot:CAMPEP_0198199400 /NCGR_PEP_ID=MMETSP1445-20131203/2709_1 /TAXON_ID=36898 /ORGANISM="Pyramimonas sp., Strain CCMP2087" /LENGTH=179 /DNA_ID=CAMNT_0043869239 /DNA_START=621 /DNA_END=1161 /DNA_ORIENTATION=+
MTLPIVPCVELAQSEHFVPESDHRDSHRVKLGLDLRQENRVVAAQHSPEAPQEVQHHGSIGGHLAANSRLVAQGIPHRRVSEPLKVGHAGSDRKESALEHGRAALERRLLLPTLSDTARFTSDADCMRNLEDATAWGCLWMHGAAYENAMDATGWSAAEVAVESSILRDYGATEATLHD